MAPPADSSKRLLDSKIATRAGTRSSRIGPMSIGGHRSTATMLAAIRALLVFRPPNTPRSRPDRTSASSACSFDAAQSHCMVACHAERRKGALPRSVGVEIEMLQSSVSLQFPEYRLIERTKAVG